MGAMARIGSRSEILPIHSAKGGGSCSRNGARKWSGKVGPLWPYSAVITDEQAVLVYLKGAELPDSVSQQFDVATLEDQLIDAIEHERLGEFAGNELGPEGTILYMYGSDREKLFSGVEALLRSYPLYQGARVVI